MARIVVVLVLLAAVVAAGSAVFARGSEAAPRALAVARPQHGPAPEAGPPALPEALATIQRTFVSISGSDANPCTRAEPCRNFAAAIANTTEGGEVIALDSGGYGAFSIDKAITIAGAPGAHVALTSFSGTGITVNAGASDTVVLRNLYVTGLGGSTGISFEAGGSLHVESVVAAGFTADGLHAAAENANLFVRGSVFRHNAGGLFVEGSLRVQIADSRADLNNFGIVLIGARGSIVRSAVTRSGFYGFDFESGAVVAVSDSLADGTVSGAGVGVFDNGTQITLSRVSITNSLNNGLITGFDNPTARITDSIVTGNLTGLLNASGTVETLGDNVVRGNTTETFGTITTVGKS